MYTAAPVIPSGDILANNAGLDQYVITEPCADSGAWLQKRLAPHNKQQKAKSKKQKATFAHLTLCQALFMQPSVQEPVGPVRESPAAVYVAIPIIVLRKVDPILGDRLVWLIRDACHHAYK